MSSNHNVETCDVCQKHMIELRHTRVRMAVDALSICRAFLDPTNDKDKITLQSINHTIAELGRLL